MPKPAEHGGDLGAIRHRFPTAPLPWIDLSTGINPVPYPVAGLPIEIWSRLPTREAEQRLLARRSRSEQDLPGVVADRWPAACSWHC